MKLTEQINDLLEAKMVDLDSVVSKMRKDVEPKLIKDIESRIIKQAKDMLAKIKKENITSVQMYNMQNKWDKLDSEIFLGMIDNGDIPRTMRVKPEKASLKKEHKEYAKKRAERDGGEILDKFVFKANQKLEKVILNVGNPKSYKMESFVSGGVLNTVINMEWKSGAKFQFRTQIVYGMSVNGKWFAKYPGTFHDVVLGDGSKMKKASEKKMLDQFRV